MEVSQTIETKETLVYETESHYFRINPEALNTIQDGKNADVSLYKRIAKTMNKHPSIDADAGIQRDMSRDMIFKHITDRDPLYKFDGKQMVLSEYEEKDAPNIEASKGKKKVEA